VAVAGSTENIPDDFEVLSTIDTSALASEYIARHKPDSALVRLRVYDFSQTDSPTTRRNLREYLRSDITFMEELEEPGLIRIFDYSDTKSFFWIATQPAKVEKLAKRFDFLASQSLQFRQQLARQFLEAIQRIHNNGVVHRNLSGEAVFLSQDLKILIGDFGLACYSTDQQDTRHDTTAITTVGYQPPEVRDARTFSCDPSCDIFSAGLLVFEILTSSVLPKDHPGEIGELLHGRLNEELAKGTFGSPTAEVILKAASPSPDKRWPSARAFADALRNSFEEKRTLQAPESMGPTATIAMTEPAEPSQTIPIDTVADVTRQRPAPPAAPSGVAETITPLEATHEIWNGRYEILEKIGEGGQAVVYRALDHLTNEEIAIKTMWARHRDDRAAINRLKQGAMVARSLTHRNIIKTYSVEQRTDADAFGNYVFVCMELIRSKLDLGRVLETRRAAGKRIRLDEALHITRQLLDALIYAHEHTIHRDIKPGNIMLVPRDDRAPADFSDLTKFDTRLIDFGIAKVLSQKHIDVTGKGFRSAHYGAPELADAKTGVDARADLFSVGVIMYQMLAGSSPRKGSPPASKVNKDVSSALAQVIDKAVSADREKRFKTAAEFAKEIQLAVSRFNWVRKAAKIAAMLVIGLCIAATVKYILPEPDYLPVQDSVEILKQRNPGTQIAALDENTVVTYSDIADFASYDPLRQTAIDKLETVQMAGSQKFK
jgi:serine/threonine protein kinase